jgi:hypothetical protein
MFAAGATGAIPATPAVTVVPSAMPPTTVPKYTPLGRTGRTTTWRSTLTLTLLPAGFDYS